MFFIDPADLAMIYLWVVTSHCIKTVEKEETESGARTKLMVIAREAVPRVGDRNYFMGGLIKDATDADALSNYFKTLKEILVNQLLRM